jgi:hypothetical protein
MTRSEHIAWAKQRALALPHDVANAMASWVSDLGKHEETVHHASIELLGMHALSGLLDAGSCRELIEGSS